MPQYLLAGYLPDNFDPSTQDQATVEAIYELNREMIAAGVRKFACGLGKTVSLRAQPNGEVLLTDGPYLEAKEFVGSYFVVDVDDEQRALEIARSYPALRFGSNPGGGLEVWPLMAGDGGDL